MVQIHRLRHSCVTACITGPRLHNGSHKPGRLAWLLPREVSQVNWPFHYMLKYVIWRTEIHFFFSTKLFQVLMFFFFFFSSKDNITEFFNKRQLDLHQTVLLTQFADNAVQQVQTDHFDFIGLIKRDNFVQSFLHSQIHFRYLIDPERFPRGHCPRKGYEYVRLWRPPFHAPLVDRKGPISSKRA